MSGEPRNVASEFTRRQYDILNDRDQVMSGGFEATLAPDYTQVDHRRLGMMPPGGTDQFGALIAEWETLTGQWPRFTRPEILAVRGDRLVLVRMRIEFGDQVEREMLLIGQMDEAVDRHEATHMFDPEQLDEALALLDRLDAELGGD